MYTSEKVKAYNYVRNCDAQLHSKEELVSSEERDYRGGCREGQQKTSIVYFPTTRKALNVKEFALNEV